MAAIETIFISHSKINKLFIALHNFFYHRSRSRLLASADESLWFLYVKQKEAREI